MTVERVGHVAPPQPPSPPSVKTVRTFLREASTIALIAVEITCLNHVVQEYFFELTRVRIF